MSQPRSGSARITGLPSCSRSSARLAQCHWRCVHACTHACVCVCVHVCMLDMSGIQSVYPFHAHVRCPLQYLRNITVDELVVSSNSIASAYPVTADVSTTASASTQGAQPAMTVVGLYIPEQLATCFHTIFQRATPCFACDYYSRLAFLSSSITSSPPHPLPSLCSVGAVASRLQWLSLPDVVLVFEHGSGTQV